MGSDLREQLRRLGVGQGAQAIRATGRRRRRPLEALVPGEVVETRHGPFYLHRESYPEEYAHGHHTLSDLLRHGAALPAQLARDERLADIAAGHLAFVDTETTGLAGGTGTYAFLVGVGLFEGDRFTIHQFFMRDFDEEPALLYALGEMLDGCEAVVTFNGRHFDLPLLKTRFLMCRQPPRMIGAPHLDLLPPARAFWKHRLESCALSSLEAEVLGVQRAQADVPGWLIPSLYVEYARTGDAGEMPKVFYHNAQDILSLVTLAARQCDLLAWPLPDHGQVPGEDLYGLGRFLQAEGEVERAEMAFVQAARTSRSHLVRESAMRELAYLLKRQGRREEALPWWRELAEASGAAYACVELAKYYEWHQPNPVQAIAWTERGIALVRGWPPGPKRRAAEADLEHRRERLRALLTT